MFQVARIVGQTLREVIATTADTGQQSESTFDATLIVGGQIADGPPRLFLIYPEGNFIEAGKGTPYDGDRGRVIGTDFKRVNQARSVEIYLNLK